MKAAHWAGALAGSSEHQKVAYWVASTEQAKADYSAARLAGRLAAKTADTRVAKSVQHWVAHLAASKERKKAAWRDRKSAEATAVTSGPQKAAYLE
jgi:hypothetical protein